MIVAGQNYITTIVKYVTPAVIMYKKLEKECEPLEAFIQQKRSIKTE
jgi:hypothetical protein